MTQKFRPNHLAVGTWDPQPHKRVLQEQTAAKIRVLLQDKLITLGKPVSLWLPVNGTVSGVVACTCVKDTTQIADRNCLTCHGTKFAPGYLKFQHETLFWCSAEADVEDGLVLTDMNLARTKKVNVVMLNDDALSGTIITQDKAFTNPRRLTYGIQLAAFIRASGSSVNLEYSLDAGDNWTQVTLSQAPSGQLGWRGSITGTETGTGGNIRFRVTLERASTDDISPAFEILRMRRVKPETININILKKRDDYEAGKILLLRTWVQTQNSLDPLRGSLTAFQGDRSWTAPLDFFDTSLTAETRAVQVRDEAGPHPFYEYGGNVLEVTRFPIVKVSFNEQFTPHFTHQFFDDRRAQENEPYADVW